LDVGLLNVGDFADCIVVEDLKDFKTLQSYINGELVFDEDNSKIDSVPFEILNNFNTNKKEVSEFRYESSATLRLRSGQAKIRVIEALEGQLVTNEIIVESLLQDGNLVSN